MKLLYNVILLGLLVFVSGCLDSGTKEKVPDTTTISVVTTSTLTTTSSTTVTTSTTTTTTSIPTASCYDNIRNQNETGIDCGGTCGPCMSIGVRILNVSECDSMGNNNIYVNLSDENLQKKKWGVRDPSDYFKLYCKNESVENFIRLERKVGDSYAVSNMYQKSVAGAYRLKVSCNRDYFIKDISVCDPLRLRITYSKDWGEAVHHSEKGMDEDMVENATTTIVTTSTTTSTTTTIVKTTPMTGYRQLTLKVNTYCPTCIPFVKYRLERTNGVVSSKFTDPSNKIWVIVYNQTIVDKEILLSRIADFDPEIIADEEL